MLGIQAPSLSSVPRVSHRFFQRIGGTSPAPWRSLNTSFDVRDAPARVEENLARVRFQLGVVKGALFTAKQVHGARVVEARRGDDPERVAAEHADALFTLDPDVGVGVRTADCAPILLASDDGRAVAAVHAGWRGAVGGIVEATIAALDARGVPPATLRAAVGPCIGLDAFEVGPEVVDAAAKVVDVEGLHRRGVGDRMHLDLAGVCARVLQKAGVARVERVGDCTATRTDLYFSHRAEHGDTGRQISAIATTTPPSLDDEAFR